MWDSWHIMTRYEIFSADSKTTVCFEDAYIRLDFKTICIKCDEIYSLWKLSFHLTYWLLRYFNCSVVCLLKSGRRQHRQQGQRWSSSSSSSLKGGEVAEKEEEEPRLRWIPFDFVLIEAGFQAFFWCRDVNDCLEGNHDHWGFRAVNARKGKKCRRYQTPTSQSFITVQAL